MLTRNLPCKLTAAEHAARSDSLAGLVVQIDEKEIAAKYAAKVSKEEIGLVKELEKREIGRPSTYASIISTLLKRNYVEKEGRALRPTDTGEVVDTRAMTPGELQLEIMPKETADPEITVVADDARRSA